jgi:hypothetical protein
MDFFDLRIAGLEKKKGISETMNPFHQSLRFLRNKTSRIITDWMQPPSG